MRSITSRYLLEEINEKPELKIPKTAYINCIKYGQIADNYCVAALPCALGIGLNAIFTKTNNTHIKQENFNSKNNDKTFKL
jgi:hypothetical protein